MNMPKVTLPECEVLEFENRAYTGKDGTAKQFRSLLVKYDGKILKFGVDKSCTSDDLQGSVDKTVDLVMGLSTFGDSLEPSFRVVGVSA